MFQFRQFTIHQDLCAMKVGTDGVLLGAWAEGGDRILDVGTGTGLIALMMAQRHPSARIVGLDVDLGAVRQASANASSSPFCSQLTFLHEPVQQHGGTYDAIVSNPPYFSDSLLPPDTRRGLARHTGSLSYAELMDAAVRLMSAEGVCSVIVPADYRRRMEDEAIFRGLFLCRQCAVSTVSGKPPKRYLLAFRRQPASPVMETMTLGDAYFQRLTAGFYL